MWLLVYRNASIICALIKFWMRRHPVLPKISITHTRLPFVEDNFLSTFTRVTADSATEMESVDEVSAQM